MKVEEDGRAAQATGLAVPAYQEMASREFAERLGSRRRESGAPVRTVFVSDESVDRPPFAQLLNGTAGRGGGGRGGQLRAKLYLSLLWVCARPPFTVNRPARAWAALLGLPDHEDRGVRRIHQAFHDLQDRGFVTVEDRGGHPPIITLLSERGDRSPYTPAPDAYNDLKNKAVPIEELRKHIYFRVPSSVWTAGHIARLNGPSLAMLLALLSERRGNSNPGVWFSPDRARDRFGFASSTRRDGLDHLRQLGLVNTSIRVVSETGTYIDFARRRNVHTLIDLV